MASNQKPAEPKKLYRSETNRIIGGVAGGLGEFFQVDPSIIRILFVLMVIFGGAGVLLYIILWIILPTESSVYGTSDEHIRKNVDEIKNRAEKFAHEISRRDEPESRYWWGLLIVFIGLIFLSNNFGIFNFFNFGLLWPLILIIFGLLILFRKR